MNQPEADLGIPALLLTGHDVKCTPGVFDEATRRQAMPGLRTRAARPPAQQPAPDGSPSHSAPARRTP
ncbi:hypothetical protein [Streptomyces sp. NPDC048106]|uniref:hypothetical protein n=1 Tax=Streptomyces sp. NPDC048106 TaxID=3155750 RepID=UPI003451FA51